jgi:hypothetical protein
MARAVDAFCEKCHKVKPDTRPANDVRTATGHKMMLCAWCWVDMKPPSKDKDKDKADRQR